MQWVASFQGVQSKMCNVTWTNKCLVCPPGLDERERNTAAVFILGKEGKKNETKEPKQDTSKVYSMQEEG